MVGRTLLSFLAGAVMVTQTCFASFSGLYRISHSTDGDLSPSSENRDVAQVLPRRNDKSQVWKITYENGHMIRHPTSGLYLQPQKEWHVAILAENVYLWNIVEDKTGGVTIQENNVKDPLSLTLYARNNTVCVATNPTSTEGIWKLELSNS
ncbi:hypothetical protein B0O80DRAFT_212361 [Mortierella sp. GBAus27b]|nr:hypothetical protein B0O80DRAFT_212361 [Mortierella sp. GBAus27b]